MAITFYILTSLLALGVMALGAFLAFKRGFFGSAVKCAASVVAFLISFVITKIITSAAVSSVGAFLGSIAYYDLGIGSDESLKTLIDAISVAALAPFVFVVIFFVLKLIFDCVFFAINKKVIKDRKVIDFKYSKAVSCVLGCVISFVCLYTALIPINGYIAVGSDFYYVFRGESDDITSGAADGVFDGLNKNPVKTLTYAMGGRALFDNLTTFKVNSQKYCLGKELRSFSAILSNLSSLADADISDWGGDQARALREISKQIKNTPLLNTLLADITKEMSHAWLEGDGFMGVEMPQNASSNGVVNETLEIFFTASPDTMACDIETLFDALAVFCDHGAMPVLFGEDMEESDAVAVIGSEGLISDVFLIFHENERFDSMISFLTGFWLKTVAASLDVPTNEELQQQIYSEISERLREAYVYTGKELEEEASKVFIEVFEKYGVPISEKDARNISVAFLEESADDSDVTFDDVGMYFEGLALVYTLDGKSEREILDIYTASNGSEAVSQLFGENEIDRISSVQNRASLVSLLKPSGEEALNVVISLAPSMYLISNDITIETIEEKTQIKDASTDEIMELGRCLESSCIEFESILLSIPSNDSNSSAADIIRAADIDAVCRAFEMLCKNKYIGEVSTDILNAFLKSRAGISDDIREIIDNSDDSDIKDATITGVLKNLHETLLIVDTVSNSLKSHEQKVESVEAFLNNLDRSSSRSLSKAMSPGIVKKMGVPTATADTVSDMLGNMFFELSVQKDDKIDKNESEAVKYLFDIAIVSSSQTNDSIFEEGGKIQDSDKFVESIVNSRVAASTIINTVFDDNGDAITDPLGLSEKMNDSDREVLIKTLDRFGEKEGITDKNRQTMDAIAVLFGIEWKA